MKNEKIICDCPHHGNKANKPCNMDDPACPFHPSDEFTKRDGALTPLGEQLQKPCPRCEQPWIRHDCPVKGGVGVVESCSIYKHMVYNPHMKNIQAVIQEAQDEENLNSGLEWQFVRTRPVTEYEWVAIFEKWVY